MEVEITITDNYADYNVLEYDATYKMLTGINKGTATVTATGTDPTTNETVIASVTIKVFDSTGLINNVDYYLMNYHTGKLLALSSELDANSVSICGVDRVSSAPARCQWTVITNTDGTTRLQSVYSSTGRSAYVSGSNLILYNSTGSRTKLNLYRVESGLYKGKYQILYDGKYLYMNNSGTVGFTTISTTTSYWTLMAVEKGCANIYSHDYYYTNNGVQKHYDTTDNNSEFFNAFQELGYSAYISVNETAEYAYNQLPDDHIFVFRGHGEAGRIAFKDSGGNTTDRIFANTAIVFGTGYSICSRYENANDQAADNRVFLADNALANLRCAVLLGCKTGVDYSYTAKTYNLVNAFFEKGAHFVVGTTESILTDDGDEWLSYFIAGIKAKLSVKGACDYANDQIGSVYVVYTMENGSEGERLVEVFPITTVGDGNQYLE